MTQEEIQTCLLFQTTIKDLKEKIQMTMTTEQINDADALQQKYNSLSLEERNDKKVLKDMCKDFVKKYKIPESKAIRLARTELSVFEVEKMFKEVK